MDNSERLRIFYEDLREVHDLTSIYSLLEWDQQVNMPCAGAQGRSRQLERIERLRHLKITDSFFLDLTQRLFDESDQLAYADQVNVRETQRNCERQRKLPVDFVGRKARACADAYNAWTVARPESNYRLVEPYLQAIVALNREETQLVGYETEPYDALLDTFEKGAKLHLIKPMLLSVADSISGMLPRIQRKFLQAEELKGDFSEEMQVLFAKRVMAALGFDFQAGRLDTSPHPFCTTIGNGDVRITTRYSKKTFLGSLYGVIHETGHALYDMGLPQDQYGTPMGSAASLGVHESQSRFFENLIGRSETFCEWLVTLLPEYFPERVRDINVEALTGSINRVARSLIRVEADEVTYSLHVIIRTLLEDELIRGNLTVRDLPEAWNSMYERYLGVRPESDREGVLQDVHWYSGTLGYFPTYVLGNLYGTMMLDKMKEDVPGYVEDVRHGSFERILGWLRENVHSKGMQFTGPELIKRITGEDLSERPFLRYLEEKYVEG